MLCPVRQARPGSYGRYQGWGALGSSHVHRRVPFPASILPHRTWNQLVLVAPPSPSHMGTGAPAWRVHCPVRGARRGPLQCHMGAIESWKEEGGAAACACCACARAECRLPFPCRPAPPFFSRPAQRPSRGHAPPGARGRLCDLPPRRGVHAGHGHRRRRQDRRKGYLV